jgi:predicted DNA-binding transcriptional regulator YafY
LRFRPENLYRVYDDYDEGRIVRNPDGTYDVTVTFPEDEWVYGYILSFGNSVEVLEPPHIRDIIRERIQKALAFYK